MRSPMLVHAPAERRRPGVAGLEDHDFQFGEFLEHALHDHADHDRLQVRHEGVVLLHVIGRPAAAGRRVPAIDVGLMQAEWQTRTLRGSVDRPIAAASERLARARRHDHLRKRTIVRAQLDLGDRGLGILLRHHDAGAQPRFLAHEEFKLPFVHRMRERSAEIEVALLEARAVAAHQHAVFDAVGIKMLRAHEIDIGAGRPAVRRERIRRAGQPPSCADRRSARPTGPAGCGRRRSRDAHASAPTGTG